MTTNSARANTNGAHDNDSNDYNTYGIPEDYDFIRLSPLIDFAKANPDKAKEFVWSRVPQIAQFDDWRRKNGVHCIGLILGRHMDMDAFGAAVETAHEAYMKSHNSDNDTQGSGDGAKDYADTDNVSDFEEAKRRRQEQDEEEPDEEYEEEPEPEEHKEEQSKNELETLFAQFMAAHDPHKLASILATMAIALAQMDGLIVSPWVQKIFKARKGFTVAAINSVIKRAREEMEKDSRQQGDTSHFATQDDTHFKALMGIGRTATLFHTSSGDLYGRVSVGDHYEVRAINEKGSAFRRWLTNRYYMDTGRQPSANAITQAMETLAGLAEMQGETHDVYTRSAYHDGAIYVDLGRDDWKAVKITAEGWEVVSDYPVYFRRPNGLRPMPIPTRGGSLNELRTFVNAKSEDDWKMMVAWELMVYHPRGPYPILGLSGEQGTAKSFTTKRLRNFTDPNFAPTRMGIRNAEELAIAAKNSRIVALDNLSHMSEWLADALCGVATGAGLGGRKLYTNDEESLFNEKKPVAYNGIEGLATRPDFGDRVLAVELAPISKKSRKTTQATNQIARVPAMHPTSGRYHRRISCLAIWLDLY